MIHVGMGYKHMGQPQHFARRQGVQIPQVEQQCSPLKQTFNVQRGITPLPVDQFRVK
jgi:hypothetical protein